MHGSRRYLLTFALAFGAALASGCVNLGAVRDFADSSSRITAYRTATEHYLESADRQLANLPAAARFDATRKNLQALDKITARDKATLLGLHATTTGYMKALARLAGEGAYEISSDIGKVAKAIRASDALGINEDHVRAYDNIAQRVTDWVLAAKQARDVRHLVTENGADMDKLLEAMQLATEAYGIVLQQEIQSYELVADYRQAQWLAELPGDTVLTPERRETIATLLRRSELAEKATQQRMLKAQRAASSGLKRVRQAHRTMLENVDTLSSERVQELLREAADDMKSIRRSFTEL